MACRLILCGMLCLHLREPRVQASGAVTGIAPRHDRRARRQQHNVPYAFNNDRECYCMDALVGHQQPSGRGAIMTKAVYIG